MSQIANIVVFDGAATPVSHTLVPISVTKEKGEIACIWREKLASLPDEAQVSLTMRQKYLNSGVCRTEFTEDVPVMESVSGANSSGYTASPRVAFIDRNQWINFAHPRSTVTSRRLSRQVLVNISGNVSTSVAPSTAGPFSEAVDQLVAAT